MSFQPVVPLGGYAGWAFLQRTEATQRTAFEQSPVMQRETDYFAQNIGAVLTPEDLVKDHLLLKVTLGAFGLEDDMPNKAFIQKILEEGVLEEGALANRLADSRYFEMAKAFGFDLGTPSTQISTFPAEIVELYEDRQFEVAVGNQSENIRLAMSLQRDLVGIAEGSDSEDAKWFRIMGNPPLRAVFETAFGLPASFGAIDLDQQLKVFKSRSESAFGGADVSQFAKEESRDALIRRFFALGEIGPGGLSASSGALSALTLLQSSTIPPLT